MTPQSSTTVLDLAPTTALGELTRRTRTIGLQHPQPHSKRAPSRCPTFDSYCVQWSLCLNASRWDAINEFAQSANLSIVLGLSWPGVDGELGVPRDSAHVPEWNGTNPLALLRYSVARGYKLAAIELGEELTPRPGTASFANLVDGYARLRDAMKSLLPNPMARPKLLVRVLVCLTRPVVTPSAWVQGARRPRSCWSS